MRGDRVESCKSWAVRTALYEFEKPEAWRETRVRDRARQLARGGHMVQRPICKLLIGLGLGETTVPDTMKERYE